MSRDTLYRWGIFPLWLLLTSTLLFRQPIPIDETRYLSVAWEMWLRDDFLVPYLNGQTYSHKPPLLFWLFHIGWWFTDVNEWWPRLVGPLCALVNLLLTRSLAAKLWPDDPRIALKAPWILIATLLWTLFATATMFDILLTCCVLVGMLGLFESASGKTLKGWCLFALAIGLGLLAKGPVIFLHLLPTAGLVVFWQSRHIHKLWLIQLILATLAGCALALCWALPAAMAGGEEYASAILWHQTADRTVGTRIHARAFTWYLLFLPLLFFPWVAWPRFWHNLKRCAITEDRGLRLCMTWLVSTFVIFSWLPSKQLHYLIPMLPAFALICTRILSVDARPKLLTETTPSLLIGVIGLFLMLLPNVPGLAKLNWVQGVEPYWGFYVILIAMTLAGVTILQRKLSVMSLSIAIVAAIVIGFYHFFQYTGLQYNLKPAALKIKHYNEQNIPLAFVGDYQGQFHFLGRLKQALPVITSTQIQPWARQHAGGYLIFLQKDRPEQADYIQPHREYWLAFKSVAQVLDDAKLSTQEEPTARSP